MNIFIVYVVAAFLAALLLSRKSDRKTLSFIIIFWIFTQPIFNTVLLIKTPGLGFDLQPNRLLLFSLFPFLFISAKRNDPPISRPPFEKYIYIYLLLTFISLAINFSEIRKQTLGVVPAEIITFLVVYSVTKKHATLQFFESIINAILCFAVISALIALVQVGIDSTFLKAGEARIAFGRVVRSTGVFQEEYELGYLQVLAVMIAMQKLKGSFWQKPLVIIFLAGLITTFHRLDILIVFACWVSFVWMTGTPSQKAASYGAMAVALISAVVLFTLFEAQIGKSDFVAQRLKEDTVSGRFRQYEVVLEELPEFMVTGMGDYTNKQYWKLMEKHKMMKSVKEPGVLRWHYEPYGVHNGFLEVGLFYGVAAMLVFIAILFSMLRYFKKLLVSPIPYSVAPFYGVLIWVLANISNGISSFRIYFVLLVAILIGSMVSLQRRQNAASIPNR